MLTQSSTSLPVLPSEKFFLQMVSSKCSRSRSPLLLCRCCLKKKPNSDQTPPDKPYHASSKPSNCPVSAQTRACRALKCVTLHAGRLFWTFNAHDCTSRAEKPARRLAKAGGWDKLQQLLSLCPLGHMVLPSRNNTPAEQRQKHRRCRELKHFHPSKTETNN